MSEWTGKRYVVTGAASGIGHAVATRLSAVGAEVTSLDRNPPMASVAAHVSVDLADVAAIDKALDQLDGPFDGLLEVAGVPGTAPADVVFAVNTLAVRHLAESMFERLAPGAAIVIVSSTAGFGWSNRLATIREFLGTESYEEGASWFRDHPQAGNAYNFSKECTTVYTMTMALAARELGFRINAVLPGPVETPILVDFEQTMGKDMLDGVKALLGRHASADDIAAAIMFLASPASGWINGHPLIVDGGITAAVSSGLVPAPEI
jgi:NAD(P)-dependent dehydrogenase (short-subunit alcohol dehydrogenase family)